jgi:predicted ribonuclease YlaK
VLKPEIKLVSMQGVAGTGKTLIALAAASGTKKRVQTNLFSATYCTP